MSETEDRAKARGWRDKESFTESGGDPEKWRDAETFLKVADDHNGMLRENIKRMEDTLGRIERERSEDRKTFEEFRKFSESATKKAEERAYNEAKREYEKSLSELKQGIKAAAKNGDETEVDRLTTRIDTLEKPTPPEVKKDDEKKTDEHPDFVAFRTANTWYGDDAEMSAYADSAGQFVQRTKPHLIGKPAFFDEVLKQVKKMFPDKFEGNGTKKASSVEGGGSDRGSDTSGKKHTWTDLPDDAKEACKDFMKTIPGFTKEQYLKGYFGEA